MRSEPIFIHSLFRSGSTYFWSKFRELDTFCCFYEPFHPVLLNLTIENPIPFPYDKQTTDAIHHPQLDKHHMFEYQGLLRGNQKGIPFFKKEFSFDDFCETGNRPDIKAYIDFLISNSGGKIPFLQFNRSGLRTKWFKENFPQSLNVFLVRNPRDQWQSYVSFAERNHDRVFVIMDLLVSGINMEKSCFHELASHIPLVQYHSETFDDQRLIYGHFLDAYSLEEMYAIFYHIWLSALIHNLLYADVVVNMKLLGKNASYTEKILRFLSRYPIGTLDFKDARIATYREFALDSSTMETIERESQKRILQPLNEDDKKSVLSSLSDIDMTDLYFDRNALLDVGESGRPTDAIDEMANLKYRHIIQIVGNEIVSQNTLRNSLEGQIRCRDRQIEILYGRIFEKDRELDKRDDLLHRQEEQIKKGEAQLIEKESAIEHKEFLIQALQRSYSFRLGHLFLSPIILIKKTVYRIVHLFSH